MHSVRAGSIYLLTAILALGPAFATTKHHKSTGHARILASKLHRRRRSHVIHGQRSIDSGRATQIQTALIEKKYLSGAPSGQWDVQTQEAMKQYQADHGWQTRITPDSRALIALGLGPSQPAPAAALNRDSSGSSQETDAAEPVAGDNTLASVHSISQ